MPFGLDLYIGTEIIRNSNSQLKREIALSGVDPCCRYVNLTAGGDVAALHKCQGLFMKFPSALVGAVACLTAALGGTSASQASLIGTNVTLNYDLSAQQSTDILNVGAGVEVTCTGSGGGNANVCGFLTAPVQTVDIGASSILYSYTGSGSAFNAVNPNRFDFENLNPGFTIGNVILSTNITGLDLTRVTFTGSSVQIDMNGLPLNDTRDGSPDFFNIGLTSAVPEPSTWAMMILGFAGIGFMAYRQKRRALSVSQA